MEDHRISFETEAIGLPHLVKISYFPNWRAKGAEGPYLMAPSLMMVIPTEESVVIEFGNRWAEWLGWALTLGGILALAVPRWRRTLIRWTTGSEESLEASADQESVAVGAEDAGEPVGVAEESPDHLDGD